MKTAQVKFSIEDDNAAIKEARKSYHQVDQKVESVVRFAEAKAEAQEAAIELASDTVYTA